MLVQSVLEYGVGAFGIIKLKRSVRKDYMLLVIHAFPG